jgi:hypothetical protein
MAIKIKVQKDYLLTEATVETTDLNALGEILKATKTNAKIVAVFNQGGVIGVNIEQRTKISESISTEVRKLIGVEDRDL